MNKNYEDHFRSLKDIFAMESINMHNSLDTIRYKLNFHVPEEWIEDQYVKTRVRDFLNVIIPQSKEGLERGLDKRVKYYYSILVFPIISYEIRKDYSQPFSDSDIRVNGILLNMDNLEEIQSYIKRNKRMS